MSLETNGSITNQKQNIEMASYTCDPNRRIGLLNATKQNNCFLNSAVQLLCVLSRFHLGKFNDAFSSYICSNQAVWQYDSLVYQLALLHYHYFQDTTEEPLDPYELRVKVANANALFPLEERGDAVEVLNFLLLEVHRSIVTHIGGDLDNQDCGRECPAHICFKLELLEEFNCKCGIDPDPRPWDFSSFSYQIHVEEILTCALRQFPEFARNVVPALGRLRDVHSSKQTIEKCISSPPKCSTGERSFQLLTAPEVLLLNIVGEWDTLTLQCRKIMQVISLFPGEMTIDSLFPGSHRDRYRIKGWIVYGFGHYFAYIRDSRYDLWHKFNDKKICHPERGGTFYASVADMIECNFHPVAICYEKIPLESEPVCVYFQESEWRKVETVVTQLELRNGLRSDDFDDISLMWTCERCTVRNNPARTVCGTCDLPKPKAQSSLPQSGSESQSLKVTSGLYGLPQPSVEAQRYKSIPESSAKSGLPKPVAELGLSNPSNRMSVQPQFNRESQLPKPVNGSSAQNGGLLLQRHNSIEPTQVSGGYDALTKRARSLPVDDIQTCKKCSKHFPRLHECVCKRYVTTHMYKDIAKHACPGCCLLFNTKDECCSNCGIPLLWLDFTRPCKSCGSRIEKVGFCTNCRMEVEASPCPFCKDDMVKCANCS